MKRSEMVDLIGDYLAIDGVILSSAMTIDNIANEILELIEKEGMLPPKHPFAPRCITTNGFVWELEKDEQLVNI